VTGILVHGDNHFIVRGPVPDRDTALALIRHWSLIQIGATTPLALNPWQIITREYRENLSWAVVAPGESATSPAVIQLLSELAARGIVIQHLSHSG
jgi:hypothetical protein